MRRIALAVGLIALAACSKGEDGNQAAAASGAGAAAKAAIVFEPGEWEVKTTVTAVDMPGAPAEVTKQMVGKVTSVRHCMTEEEATRTPGDMFRQSMQGQCDYENFDMAGGRIAAKMTCKGEQPGETMETTIDGRYGRETYKADMTMTMALPGAAAPMSMAATTEGKRLGACAPGEEAKKG